MKIKLTEFALASGKLGSKVYEHNSSGKKIRRCSDKSLARSDKRLHIQSGVSHIASLWRSLHEAKINEWFLFAQYLNSLGNPLVLKNYTGYLAFFEYNSNALFNGGTYSDTPPSDVVFGIGSGMCLNASNTKIEIQPPFLGSDYMIKVFASQEYRQSISKPRNNYKAIGVYSCDNIIDVLSDYLAAFELSSLGYSKRIFFKFKLYFEATKIYSSISFDEIISEIWKPPFILWADSTAYNVNDYRYNGSNSVPYRCLQNHTSHKMQMSYSRTNQLDGTGTTITDIRYGLLKNNKAYMSSNSIGKFQIINVSNPSSPVYLGSFGNSGTTNARGFVVLGNYAFLCCAYSAVIQILDLTNESSIALYGTITNSSGGGIVLTAPENLCLIDSFLYVMNIDGVLSVIDIDDIDSPAHTWTYTPDASIGGLKAYQTHMFVINNNLYICGNYGVEIIDVSNPSEPVHLYTLLSGDDGGNIVFSDSSDILHIDNYLLVLSQSDSKIVVVDVTTPTNPIFVSSIGEPELGSDFHAPNLFNGQIGAFVYTRNVNYPEPEFASYCLDFTDIENPVLVDFVMNGTYSIGAQVLLPLPDGSAVVDLASRYQVWNNSSEPSCGPASSLFWLEYP